MDPAAIDFIRYIEHARTVVSVAHRDDFRADNKTPYVSHVFDVERRVALIVFLPTMASEAISRDFGQHTLSSGEMSAIARIAALGHDVREDHPEFPLRDQLLRGIPPYLVNLAMVVIEQLTNTRPGDDYLDYLIRLRDEGGSLALAIKQTDMNSNLSDVHHIPSKGRQKSMKTKYLLAHYILFGTKPAALTDLPGGGLDS